MIWLSGGCPTRGQEHPFCLQREYHEEELEVPEKGSLTSVIESCGSAHSPLSLIHSCCAGAAHLNTDICNLLGLQGPDHHHVYVAELVSPNILQANPWGPGLRPWDQAEIRISYGAPGKVMRVFIQSHKNTLIKTVVQLLNSQRNTEIHAALSATDRGEHSFQTRHNWSALWPAGKLLFLLK